MNARTVGSALLLASIAPSACGGTSSNPIAPVLDATPTPVSSASASPSASASASASAAVSPSATPT